MSKSKKKYKTTEEITLLLKEVAIARGGSCLGNYTGSHNKIEFECANKHRWFATYNNIYYNNSWCPHCNLGMGENICKLYFETIFQREFIKIRPDWLVNPKGNKLELDGYCEELGIAFEYNGEQHFSNIKHYKKNLLERQSWDAIKIKLCKENDVKLIVIPQLFTRLKLSNLMEFIKQKFLELNINVPFNLNEIKIDLSKITDRAAFIEYKKIAKSKGGKCLSDIYTNCFEKLKWQCRLNHVWEAPGYSIKNGSWCPFCAGVVPMTLEEVKNLINKKNGILLSEKYESSSKKIKICCKVCNTIWTPKINKIKAGQWCPTCGLKNRKSRRPKIISIEELKKIADKRNGKCLSNIYIDAKSKLRWQCNKCNTIWDASLSSIKRNTWCPTCACIESLKIARAAKLNKKNKS